MNGKIRVSLVATSLKGATVDPEPRPVLNIINGSQNHSNNFSDNLFSKNNLDNNVVNSIDGANALKLDESYEIKNIQDQNAIIESFENKEEKKLVEENLSNTEVSDDIPNGLSIESASYIENNNEAKYSEVISDKDNLVSNTVKNEHAPKLFSDEVSHDQVEQHDEKNDNFKTELFDQENSEEEDFEIPAFLRRQKF